MAHCHRRYALVVILVFVCATSIPSGLLAAVWPPQNQCPGDCSPCLGVDDPFCTRTSTTSSGGTGSYFCVLCAGGECRDAQVGEKGKDASCTVTTEGTTVISCVTSGHACNGIAAVNP